MQRRRAWRAGLACGAALGFVFSAAVISGGIYFTRGEGLGRLKSVVKVLKAKARVGRERLGDAYYYWRNRRFMRLYGGEGVMPAAGAEGVRVFAASALDRIFPDGRTLQPPDFTSEVALEAAGGEAESFQIVVAPGRRPLSGVRLRFGGLTQGADGPRFPPESVTWRVVGYVPTRRPYYRVRRVGEWPDPLLPGQETTVPAGRVQPFWVTVTVPRGTPPGDYTGGMEVLAGGRLLQRIPIRLRVYDFTLPREGTLTTAFDFYEHVTSSRYPRRDGESRESYEARIGRLNDAFLRMMLSYRMDPMLHVDPRSEAQLGRIDRYRVLGLSRFAVGRRGGTWGNNWPESSGELRALEPLYRTFGEMLTLNRLLDRAYIYMWDEGEIGDPRVPEVAAMLHRAYPRLRTMVCYHGLWDPDALPDWGKDIDIWTFQIDDYDAGKMRKLQVRGMEIWTYVSGPGDTGSPNLAIDFDTMDYRIIPWMCWKYGVRGFLYWCVNWWPNVDPFKDAANTRWKQNGNGLLFYPGPEGPVPSLRAEIFRDGMEDHAYLTLLSSLWDDIHDKDRFAAEAAEARALLEVGPPLVEDWYHFTRDGRVLEERRRRIGRLIERIRHRLAGGTEIEGGRR